jgi:hypothetical protein
MVIFTTIWYGLCKPGSTIRGYMGGDFGNTGVKTDYVTKKGPHTPVYCCNYYITSDFGST